MVSKLGYRKDSPYKNRKSLTIDSNHITMKDVEFPLLLVPNNDNPVIAKPGEEYMFNNSQYVKEYRLKNMKYGGQTEELLMSYMAKMKPKEQAEFLERFEELGPQEKKMLLNSLRSQMHEVRNKYEEEDYMEMEDQEMEEYMYGGKKLPEYQWAGGVKVVNGEVYPRKTGVVRNALTGEVISRPAGNPVDPLNMSRQGTTIPRNDDRVFMRTPKSTAPTYRTETGEMMTEGKKAPSYTYTEIPAEDEYVMPNPYSPAKAIQDPFTLGAPLALRGITLPAVSFPRRVKPAGVDPINPGPLPTRPVTPDPVPTRPVPTRPVTTPRAPMPKVPAVPVRGPYNDYQSPDYDFGGGGAGGSWNDTYMAQGDTITVRAPRMPIMEAETPAKTTKSGFRYQETPKAEQSPGSYTVQSGDSLSAIARRYNTTVEELARLNNISNPSVIRRGTQLTLPEMKQGGIYIDPAKRGTFKAQATRMGMGVQEAASKILSNKEDYSPAMVKKANFARNAASWKKEDGGMIEYGMGGELPEYQSGGMTPINPYTKQPLGMVWSDEEKLKTGYYDEVSPQYKFTSSGIARRAPSELGSATNLRRGANKLGISYDRIPTGRTDFDERGVLRPAVNYGDFTDPLNTRPQMTKFKKGGQLPEYQDGARVRVFNPDGSAVYVTKEEAMRRLNEITAPARTVFPLIPGGSAASRAMSGVVAMGRTSGKAAGASAAAKARETLSRSTADALGTTTRTPRPATKVPKPQPSAPTAPSTPPPPPPAPSATSTGANQMADEIFDAYNAMRPGMDNAKNVGIAKNLEFLGVGAAAIGIPTAFEAGREAARRSANVPKVAMSSSMTKFLTDQGVSSLRQQSTPSQQSTPFMLSRSSSPAPSPARSTASTPRTPAQPITGDTYTIKSGDTLSRIAQRTGMSVQELAQINNIADPNKIYAGRQLMLRQPTAPAATPTVASQPSPVVTQTPVVTQPTRPQGPSFQQTVTDMGNELRDRAVPVGMALLDRARRGPQQVNPRPAPPVLGANRPTLTTNQPVVNTPRPISLMGPDPDIQRYRMTPQLNSVVKEGFAELAGLVDNMTDDNFETVAPRVERLMGIVNKELSRTTNYQGFTNVNGEYFLVPKGAAKDRSKWVPFDTMPETSRPRLASLNTLEPQSIPTAPASIQGLAAPKRFTNTRKRNR